MQTVSRLVSVKMQPIAIQSAASAVVDPAGQEVSATKSAHLVLMVTTARMYVYVRMEEVVIGLTGAVSVQLDGWDRTVKQVGTTDQDYKGVLR